MKPSTLKPTAPMLMVPFREVRHFQPEDSLYCESINVRGQQYEWTIPAHRHEGLHQFQLLTHGSALATLDGEPLEMHAPAALMVAPGVVHGFVYERHSAGQQVTVPTQSLRTWLATAPLLDAQLHQSIHVTRDDIGSGIGECEELFALLTREFNLGRPGRAAALNAHALVLALWFLRHDAHGSSGLNKGALRDTLVQRYRVMLEKNFHHQRPVQFYADALGITADHLSRACRATTGQGALQLMHDRVALEARRLLAYTQGSVTEIALELGFDDPGHFSRFFAKTVGKAPTVYRSAVVSGLASAPGQAD